MIVIYHVMWHIMSSDSIALDKNQISYAIIANDATYSLFIVRHDLF